MCAKRRWQRCGCETCPDTHVPIFGHARNAMHPLRGLYSLWRGFRALTSKKSCPVITKDSAPLRIVQRKEKSNPQPSLHPLSPPCWHLANAKMLKPYFFCSRAQLPCCPFLWKGNVVGETYGGACSSCCHGYVCSVLKRAALGAQFWLGPFSSTAAAGFPKGVRSVLLVPSLS